MNGQTPAQMMVAKLQARVRQGAILWSVRDPDALGYGRDWFVYCAMCGREATESAANISHAPSCLLAIVTEGVSEAQDA